MKLIVNADDYGIDENRTAAILESFRLGVITQTTALVTMPYFDKAARMITDAALLDRMGLHFNLTEGAPLTMAMAECSVFCNDHGEFSCEFHRDYKRRFFLPRNTDEILKGECKAQIEKFLDSGATYLHLDSHHHVHTDYSVARILLPMASKYGFKTIRRSRNFGGGIKGPLKLYKALLNLYLTHGFESADYFMGFGDVRNAVRKLPSTASIEVMVHPMYGDHGALDMSAPLTDTGRLMSEDAKLYQEIGRLK